MLLLFLIASIALVGVFIYSFNTFKEEMNMTTTIEDTEISTEAFSSDLTNLDDLKPAINQSLKKWLDQSKIENSEPSNAANTLYKLVEQENNTICQHLIELAQNTYRSEELQTRLIRLTDFVLYLLVFPIQGDRPYLLRQSEGFENGWYQHFKQVFSRLEKDNKSISLVGIALFGKKLNNEQTLYLTYLEPNKILLPASLLNTKELAQLPSERLNLRQTLN